MCACQVHIAVNAVYSAQCIGQCIVRVMQPGTRSSIALSFVAKNFFMLR